MASRQNPKLEGKQGSKDSSSDRVNFDNERKSDFDKKWQPRKKVSGKGASGRGHRKDSGTGDSHRSDKSSPKAGSIMTPFLRNPVTLESVAKVATPVISGERPGPGCNHAAPGIMRLVYTTAPLGADPEVIRQAMNDQYSFVAHANSRNYNYSPEALMTMELAGIDAMALIALGMRVFGIMRKYEALNVYTPKTLIEACGFNYNDALKNYAKMPGDINLLIAKTRQIWVPKSMSYFERWWTLNSTIYIDSENTRDQFYVLVPAGYRKLHYANGKYSLIFTEVWENKFGQPGNDPSLFLTPHFYNSGEVSTIKWDDFILHVNNAIDSLLNNQDRGMIYGDLLNAYGAENIISLDYIDGVNFEVGYQYDMSMLTALMNSTLSTFYPTDIYLDTTNEDLPTLRQDWDFIPRVPETPGEAETSCVPILPINTLVLNFKSPMEPSAGDIVGATRFVTAGARGIGKYVVDRAHNVAFIKSVTAESSNDVPRPLTHGTEVIVSMWIYSRAYREGALPYGYVAHVFAPAYYGLTYPNSEFTTTELSLMNLLTGQLYQAFDWRPIQYAWRSFGSFVGKLKVLIDIDQTTGDHPFKDGDIICEPVAIIAEYENVYNVTAANLVNINIACVQSLAGVPLSLTASKPKGKNMK